MKAFYKVSKPLVAGEIPVEALTLRQTSGNNDRGRYLHTDAVADKEVATLRIFELSEKYATKILQQLPQTLLKMEVPHVYQMQITLDSPSARALPPHIDRGRRCAINIYTECAGEETVFYYDKDGGLKPASPLLLKKTRRGYLM